MEELINQAETQLGESLQKAYNIGFEAGKSQLPGTGGETGGVEAPKLFTKAEVDALVKAEKSRIQEELSKIDRSEDAAVAALFAEPQPEPAPVEEKKEEQPS